MGCCHYYTLEPGSESAFAIDVGSIAFGPGLLRELGDHARALGLKRVALFTDQRVGALECAAEARASLVAAGIDFGVYDEVEVEPTDRSFLAATRFAADGKFDGYVSIGGGSVMDTCKAASLYSTYPADFLSYVNPPIGGGQPVPGPLRPHIACPTTSGTGSECTGVAIFDLLSMQVKTGIASKRLRPSLALVDPVATYSLPKNVVAASGFDVLSHALESYTARPYTRRKPPVRPSERPIFQGANPWSDIGCREAVELIGQYFERAVRDAADHEAREKMMFAATLAGIAFGNSGVHLPHGMSYAVAGLVKSFHPDGYPGHEPIVPHGMAVILNAPSVFRFTGAACPERHLEAAAWLGVDVRGAAPEDAGELLAKRLVELMQVTGIPNGIGAVGYDEADVAALSDRASAQQRLLSNAPRETGRDDIAGLFRGAMRYW
ncbi:MAG TPA: hydroxyacid-oxoacid transhydrogenase [Polyangiaceae bacterium]|jgi:alcohol dehydrogenase class IV|nr:hydroxyacid-oxoacid transhydrogenase [Polyangiaceae bacterium]